MCMGQGNLVPNPSFEDFDICPWVPAQIELAILWHSSGIECTPDYYHSCCTPIISASDTFFRVGVPRNTSGVQHARSGIGYSGFYAVSNQELYPDFREYLQIELTEPIYASVRYEVSFHVSLADMFGLATGSLGAYFSESHVYRENGDVLNVEPQIQSPEGFVFNDKASWTEVRDTFSSRYGGERYMLIGNFLPDSLSNVTFVDSGATNMHAARSYYYIDDVSVVAIDSIPNSVTEVEELNFSVHPNPAKDLLHIQAQRPMERLQLYDLSGRAVLAEQVRSDRHGLNLSGIPPGIYLLEVSDRHGGRSVQKVVVQ